MEDLTGFACELQRRTSLPQRLRQVRYRRRVKTNPYSRAAQQLVALGAKEQALGRGRAGAGLRGHDGHDLLTAHRDQMSKSGIRKRRFNRGGQKASLALA